MSYLGRSCGREDFFSVEKGLSQEVSRGHSTVKAGRTEQFVVFSLPKFKTGNSQNVLMRRVWTYSRGLLKIDDLSVCGKEARKRVWNF